MSGPRTDRAYRPHGSPAARLASAVSTAELGRLSPRQTTMPSAKSAGYSRRDNSLPASPRRWRPLARQRTVAGRTRAAIDALGALTNSTSGNAGTATALAATPTQCPSTEIVTGVQANGDANCQDPLVSGPTAIGSA